MFLEAGYSLARYEEEFAYRIGFSFLLMKGMHTENKSRLSRDLLDKPVYTKLKKMAAAATAAAAAAATTTTIIIDK